MLAMYNNIQLQHKISVKPGLTVQVGIPTTREGEAGGLQVQVLPGLHNEFKESPSTE